MVAVRKEKLFSLLTETFWRSKNGKEILKIKKVIGEIFL